jgi:diadenylate cyclase
LLVNIFTPKAPLHDGAVIISGNKIVSAATTLPILEEVFDLSLGTRHKAALSLSMQSDAVGIIVSEETGIISIAVDGRLQRNLNMDDLKERISKLMSPSKIKFRKK